MPQKRSWVIALASFKNERCLLPLDCRAHRFASSCLNLMLRRPFRATLHESFPNQPLIRVGRDICMRLGRARCSGAIACYLPLFRPNQSRTGSQLPPPLASGEEALRVAVLVGVYSRPRWPREKSLPVRALLGRSSRRSSNFRSLLVRIFVVTLSSGGLESRQVCRRTSGRTSCRSC